MTAQELAVLQLSANGESIAAIAAWEAPCDRLVQLGLLRRHDKFNHEITQAGLDVLAAQTQDNNSWAEAAIRLHNSQVQARMSIEQAAQHLTIALKASKLATGHSHEQALKNWMPILAERVRQLLDE